MVCQTGLTSDQRVQEEDEEGVVTESATIKCKVSALAVQLVGAESTCDTCKRVGVVAECTYRTSMACAQYKAAKLCCSLAQGQHRQRKSTKAAGSSAAAAVIIKMTGSKSALSVFPS